MANTNIVWTKGESGPLDPTQKVLRRIIIEEWHRVRRENNGRLRYGGQLELVTNRVHARTGIDLKRCERGAHRLIAGGEIGCENPHYPFAEV